MKYKLKLVLIHRCDTINSNKYLESHSVRIYAQRKNCTIYIFVVVAIRCPFVALLNKKQQKKL